MSIHIDYKKCVGCRKCYNECPSDLFGWNMETDLPTIEYQNECWHCGICKIECGDYNAIYFKLPPQTYTDVNKRFIFKLSTPAEIDWPEVDDSGEL